MKRYLIQDIKTGKYLKRSPDYRRSWVDTSDEASLLTTKSSATNTANNICRRVTGDRWAWWEQSNSPVRVILVSVFLVPEGRQPFMPS
jgi:hypothetical protein